MIKVLLTGHSTGLGSAMAEALLSAGVSVLAISRSGHQPIEGQNGATMRQVALDLSDPGALAQWLEQTDMRDFFADASQALLINNAGQVQPIGPPGVQGAAGIASAVMLNVAAPLILADAFVAATTSCADRRLVHISSGAARNAYAGWSVYCATKAALDQHAMAVQADQVAGLRVESLAPGVIDTQMQAQIRSTTEDRFPAVARFESMKKEGALSSPQVCAALIVAHVLSDAFGKQITSDIRQLVG